MFTLHLKDDEYQVLIELLERELPNLRHEIHHTDDPDYRAFLKVREHLLARLLDTVKPHTPTPASESGATKKPGYATCPLS